MYVRRASFTSQRTQKDHSFCGVYGNSRCLLSELYETLYCFALAKCWDFRLNPTLHTQTAILERVTVFRLDELQELYFLNIFIISRVSNVTDRQTNLLALDVFIHA